MKALSLKMLLKVDLSIHDHLLAAIPTVCIALIKNSGSVFILSGMLFHKGDKLPLYCFQFR